MLDKNAVDLFEKGAAQKLLHFYLRGESSRKRGVKTRKRIIAAAQNFMRDNQGRMPNFMQMTRLARISAAGLRKYYTISELIYEALKDDGVAAEIGALIAKRKGIKAPCAEPMPWEESSKVWLWWQTVLIALARPT